MNNKNYERARQVLLNNFKHQPCVYYIAYVDVLGKWYLSAMFQRCLTSDF